MGNYSAWDVKIEDFPSDGLMEEKLMFICNFAILAPSVHNSQPWQFDIKAGRVKISIAQERKLAAGDPTGRETWVSLGACAENLLIAGEFFGLKGELETQTESYVEYSFRTAEANVHLEDLVLAMSKRATDRSPYLEKPLTEDVLAELNQINLPQVQAQVRPDKAMIDLVADLTGRAIAIALSNPSFRGELSTLVHSNWTKNSTGMPGFSLGISNPRSAIEKHLIKSGTMTGMQGRKEQATTSASAAVVLVFSEGDTPKYWLMAGRAYQRAGLIATKHGLSCSTTAAAVEAADFHLDVEELAETKGRLQAVMRIGYSAKTPRHSPRLALASVATFSS